MSWSDNPAKGFDILSFLDKNLDLTRYNLTFIGNTKIPLNNTTHKLITDRWMLAEEIRKHDVYVNASMVEACSNALIEALACGLVSVNRETIFNRELLGEDSIYFFGTNDVIAKIDNAVAERFSRMDRRNIFNSSKIFGKYISCFEDSLCSEKHCSGSKLRRIYNGLLFLIFLLLFYLRELAIYTHRIVR